DPLKVQAEDPITYTVRITATDPRKYPVKQPPQRPLQTEFSAFTDNFYIEELGPPEGIQPDPQTWEFAYRLKPKSTEVTSIPGFPFVFYRPGFLPQRLGYMTIRVPAIEITVEPRTPPPGILASP